MAAQCCDSETPETESTPIIINSGEQAVANVTSPETTKPITAQPVADVLMQPLEIRPSNRVIAPSHATITNSSHETERDANNEDGRIRGIAIHRMLQLLCEQQPPAEIPTRVAAELAIATQQHDLESWFKEANNVFQDPELSWMFSEKEQQTSYNEVSVFYKQEDQHPENDKTVLGIIDRLIETEDKVWIIDYKTHATNKPEDTAELVEQYREQIRLYSTGVQQLFPEKIIIAGLLFTASKKFFELTK